MDKFEILKEIVAESRGELEKFCKELSVIHPDVPFLTLKARIETYNHVLKIIERLEK